MNRIRKEGREMCDIRNLSTHVEGSPTDYHYVRDDLVSILIGWTTFAQKLDFRTEKGRGTAPDAAFLRHCS